jgi:hypothetical protein
MSLFASACWRKHIFISTAVFLRHFSVFESFLFLHHQITNKTKAFRPSPLELGQFGFQQRRDFVRVREDSLFQLAEIRLPVQSHLERTWSGLCRIANHLNIGVSSLDCLCQSLELGSIPSGSTYQNERIQILPKTKKRKVEPSTHARKKRNVKPQLMQE